MEIGDVVAFGSTVFGQQVVRVFRLIVPADSVEIVDAGTDELERVWIVRLLAIGVGRVERTEIARVEFWIDSCVPLSIPRTSVAAEIDIRNLVIRASWQEFCEPVVVQINQMLAVEAVVEWAVPGRVRRRIDFERVRWVFGESNSWRAVGGIRACLSLIDDSSQKEANT